MPLLDRLHRPVARVLLAGLLFLLQAFSASALPAKLGDLDEDGVPTILDVAKLAAQFRGSHPLSPLVALFADMNQDGALNEADQEALVSDILLLSTPRDLPLTSIREVSPARGEADVAVTRETILHFAHPLSPFTSIDTNRFHADFGGRKILSCVQLAVDGKKATLFYLEPLPSNARVIVTFDGNGLNDRLDRPIDADGDGQPGGVFTTEFETISTQPVPNTGVVGIVYASERGTGGVEVPLAGVTITVDGAEETLRTVTGPDGRFTLSPCPSGTFFVHIDGRTAPASSYPNGNYYPSVGKKWFAAPGRLDNPAGDLDDTPGGGGSGVIYLPCICTSTLATVSHVQETVITFPPAVLAANPALAGTEIRVPANSLYADDGTRGGKVGIAPVAPDRLPSPLPPGLNPPIVLTVQSDGATNFDRPVPLCLPNLPDPVTGKRLEPGEKSALFSFNHDIGEWEIAGSMTVTEDGSCVKTDAGVGIRQPGWHVSQPGCIIKCQFRKPKCELADVAIDLAGKASETWVDIESLYDSVLGKLIEEKEMVGFAYEVQDLEQYRRIGEDLVDNVGAILGGGKCLLSAYEASGAANPSRDHLIVQDFLNGDCRDFALDMTAKLLRLFPATAPLGFALELVLIGKDTYELFEPFGLALSAYFNELENTVDCLTPAEIQEAKALVLGNVAAANEEARRVAEICELAPTESWPSLQNRTEELAAFLQNQNSQTFQRSGVDAFFADLFLIGRWTQNASFIWASMRTQRRLVQNAMNKVDELNDKLSDPKIVGFGSFAATFNSTTLRQDGSLAVSIIVPARTGVRLRGIDDASLRSGRKGVYSGEPGSIINAGVVALAKSTGDTLDSDGDGILDSQEFVFGTDPMLSDTDGDGISDLAEVLANTSGSPFGSSLSGPAAQTKVATSASDISASSRTLAVACGGEGTAFLTTQSVAAPVMRTRVPTSSLSSAVSVGANAVLVAEAEAGFRCVALDDQLNVNFMTLLPVSGRAVSAVASGGIGYGGASGGSILELDLASGGLLRQLETGAGEIEDLAVQGDWLFARKPDRLLAVSLNGTAMSVVGQVVLSSGRTPSPNRLRIAVADGRVFCTKGDGVHIVNTANLPSVTLAGTTTGPGDDWRHFVPNGNLGLLAGKVQVTNNPFLRLPIPLSLFTIPQPGNAVNYAANFDMPGFASSVALNRGVGFVACSNGTLAVVNYLDFDRNRVPPGITLSSSVNLAAPSPTIEEGSSMRLSAAVTDDVQVGNVEFHVDGVLAFDDGAYPFEHRFLAPRRSATKTTFTVRARAVDTGGNATWSTPFTINLLPDTVPPTVRSFLPANGTMNRTVANVYVRFSELMDASTLAAPAFTLISAGADAAFDTADDAPVPYFIVYRDTDSLVRLAPDVPLVPGRYRVRAAPPVADATGNVMAAAAESIFRVYSLQDTDADGIPDDWESLLGTNPNLADSNGNGIIDGLEDRDNDGTADGVEIVRLGRDPRVQDANSNGIADGMEDSDSDGLRDGLEAVADTDVFKSDTDGDGLDDNTELAAGLNPLVSNLSPVSTALSAPTTVINSKREQTPLIATPVHSAPTSLLNAEPEEIPIIPIPVKSLPTSFTANPPATP